MRGRCGIVSPGALGVKKFNDLRFSETSPCLLFCSIDPTDESRHNRLGRLVNHLRSVPNLRAKVAVDDEGVPRVMLVANQDILPGRELLWDYGDRDPAAINAHPWLKQ